MKLITKEFFTTYCRKSLIPTLKTHCLITARKVMLLHVSVIMFMGHHCMMSLPFWLPCPMFLQGRSLSLVPCSINRGSLSRGVSVQGVYVQGVSVKGVSVQEGLCPWRGSLSRRESLCRGICFNRGLYPGVLFPGRGSLSREGVSFKGGGLCTGRGSLSREGVSVQRRGSLFRVFSLQRVPFSRSLKRNPMRI